MRDEASPEAGFRVSNGTVSNVRVIHNLALIGFMGTGKSCVGQLAASQLGFEFLDTDEWLESTLGMSISRIFSTHGEAHFRACEAALVKDLTHRRRMVIATGGGLAASDEHLASLKTHALVACLWASPETIWERVRHQGHRPLLRTADPQGRIRHLLAQRESYYRQADLLVNTERRTAKEVAHQLVTHFRGLWQPVTV
jgi:shikimate kinase